MRVRFGARALEAALIADVDELLPRGRVDLAVLARPVRVIVPGRSLRTHLSTALAGARGGAIVGLSLATLQALALEVLDRAGLPPPGSASAFDVLVRRFSREEPALAQALEPLADGYAAVTSSVRDLVDAGLGPESVEAAEERLLAAGPEAGTADERARALALLRVAGRTIEEMEEMDIGRAGALYLRAIDAIRRDPDTVLPASALLVYGFAEVSGLALDLLEALARAVPAIVYVDQPPDPAHPAEPDIGAACTTRLVERLSAVCTVEAAEEPEEAPPRLQLFKAAGAIEEAREVAHRVRELLDRGVSPERVGVVVRDLHAYRVPLRGHLRRLGVPFSGVGALSPLGGMGRRIHAMLDLLREREDAAMDRWLDALGPRGRVGQRMVQPRRWRPVRLWDLRLALRALGATRLSDVAAIDVDAVLGDRESYPLPVRRGVWQAGEDEPEETEGGEVDQVEPAERAVVLRRRTLHGDILRTAVSAAADLLTRFREWPETQSLHDHRKHLEKILKAELGWDQSYLGMPPVFGALSALEREFPRKFHLRLDELVLLVARTLYDIGAGPLGGHGAGVAVLAASEARGRTFDHLFLLGLNRDVFPRTIVEDPLLPDAVRRPLKDVIPDLPLRQDSYDAERYLFASLVAASPEVTLSWQVVDDDNKPRPPSPLVERLRWAVGAAEPELIAPLYAAPDRPLPPGRLLPVEDHVLRAALHGGRDAWGEVLPLALSEALGARPPVPLDLRVLARARVSVLDEMDPDREAREGRARQSRLGPYYGFVGELRALADPRLSPMFITTVERMSGCPWQVFLERLLRLEVPPDPMQELPGVDDRMVGNVVHLVLERVVAESIPEAPASLDEVRDREPIPVLWPEDGKVELLLTSAADDVLREAGLGLAGFVLALVERARPYLEAARSRDWDGTALSVLGVEVEGGLTVRDAAGRPREIRFKADRVDRGPDGILRLTDYKTGRGPSRAKKEGTRREHFLKRVQEGQHLQAVAYALAAGSQEAEGRYLYLKPDLEAPLRDYAVRTEDAGFADAFETAARTVLSAWDRGSFFPRLVDPTENREPSRCSRCEVAQACLRGDSGSRSRLSRFFESATAKREEGVPLSAEEQAALSVWTLGMEATVARTEDK